VHPLCPIHGDAAEPSHQDADREEKPLLLHQEVAVEVLGPAVDVADNEVPVACVRCKSNDAFLGQRFRYDLSEMEPSEENFVTEGFQHRF